MKNILIMLTMIVSTSVFAKTATPRTVASEGIPDAVTEAANNLKSSKYVKVSVSVNDVSDAERTPCDSEYNADVKVKKAYVTMDRKGNRVVRYKWEVVNTVGIDKDGKVMEICLE